jgi:hypothetical protein
MNNIVRNALWVHDSIGHYFISPEEFSREIFDDKFYRRQTLRSLYNALPCKEELVKIQQSGKFVIPGPPSKRFVRDFAQDMMESAGYLADAWREIVAVVVSQDVIGPCWYVCETYNLPDDDLRDWDEQVTDIPAGLSLLNIAEAVWCTGILNALRGTELFPARAFTSSIDGWMRFYIKGTVIGSAWGSERKALAVARKFMPRN